jgi:hypothetical protein
MKTTAIRAALVGISLLATGAARSEELSPECKALTARFVEATGATFERYAEAGKQIVFKHPLVSGMSLACKLDVSGMSAATPAAKYYTGVAVAFGGAYPSKQWFTLAAKAPLCEGLSAKRKRARECARSEMPEIW